MPVLVSILDRNGDRGRVDDNVRTALSAIGDAAAARAALLLFPECFLTGYGLTREEAHDVALGNGAAPWQDIARSAAEHEISVAIGALTRNQGRLRNTLRLFSPDGSFVQYDKTHIPNLGVDRWVEPGESGFRALVEAPFGRVGLTICYDIRFPEAIRTLALRGAQVVLVPACYPAGAERVPEYFPTVRAMENGVYVLMAAAPASDGSGSRVPGSQVIAPDGQRIDRRHGDSGLLLAEIDPAQAGLSAYVPQYADYSLDIYHDRRPEHYVW